MDMNLKIEETKTIVVKEKNKLFKIGFWFGIASIFLNFIGTIPLIGLVISIIGLTKFKKETHSGLWMGIVALILNAIYLLVNAYHNGHI